MWNWESNEAVQVSIPWNDEGNSRISEFDSESNDSPQSMQSPLRPQTTRDLQTSQESSSLDSPVSVSETYDHTPQKWKSLSDVYAQCKMSIIEPEDFTEDFNTIRTLIALAAQKGWKLWQLDVKSVFLNGVLEDEVYVDQPDGFVVAEAEDKVSSSEATLYVRNKEGVGTLIVSIYVDDIVYTGSSAKMMEEFKAEMMCKYEMSDLGLLHHFLGMGHSVALSTAEAEYVSAAETTSQAIWLRFVLEDFGEEQAAATTLFCDNTSVIAMSKNPVFHQRTKHIGRKFHFIRDAIQEGVIDLVYYKGEEQIADIFTKALPKDRFNYLRNLLGVKSTSNLEGSVEK
ncbi:unnamed protein product [Prunus brigantina]